MPSTRQNTSVIMTLARFPIPLDDRAVFKMSSQAMENLTMRRVQVAVQVTERKGEKEDGLTL